MRADSEQGGREERAPLLWAGAAFVGGALLHADRVPLWAAATALLLSGWRLATALRQRPLPGRPARVLLALALVALVLARFHTLNGLAAGTTLLMLMGALKLLETRTPRDESVLVGAGLFLLLAACLDRQDLARTPLYALEAWVCCTALAVIAAPVLGVRDALRLTARALLTALPLALLLFVLFPRLPGSFWAIPRGEEAVTGLSDTMSPGSIGRLATNYEPAFRVTFSGARPPPQERYWRGPVLHEFDGQTWRRGGGLWRTRPPLDFLGSPYRYRVTLLPSFQRWWFALDTPVRPPADEVRLTYDYQLLASDPVSTAVSFDALSYTRTRAVQPLERAAWEQDTALPEGLNPRSRALAQSLHRHTLSDAAFVAAALEYLHSNGFVYSLEPERLGADAVDDLLFNTRDGFCGHYASAFVTLMRAAGVPARVVTGYLGGEWNPIGGYLLVRQSDAHAWTEVWLAGRGWTRIDPTAVVAPERLRRGIMDMLPEALSGAERLLRTPWLARLVQRWDAANAWWGEHVVKFDYGAQLDLLARLGVRSPDARYLGWGFMLGLCAWLALVAWQVGRTVGPGQPDALGRAYARLCRKLARVAPARAPHQGPLSFAASVSALQPELAASAVMLLKRYAELRYGRAEPAERRRGVADFRRGVARLRLPRAAV